MDIRKPGMEQKPYRAFSKKSDRILSGHTEPEFIGRHAEAGLEHFVEISSFRKAGFQGNVVDGHFRILQSSAGA